MKKIIITLFAVLVSSHVVGKEVLVDKIVAVVNEDVKTMSDLRAFKRTIESRKPKMDAEEYKDVMGSEKKLLDLLVQETLIIQYAKEQDLLPSKDEIDEFIRKRMSALGMNQKELERQLASSGQTLADFKEELKMEQAKARIFEKDLKRKISISEGDYEILFKKEFNQDLNILEYRIQHIVLKSDSQAEKVYKKIKGGSDFKEMAKQYSEDKGTSTNGGDLGFIRSDDLLPELLKAIKNMSPGDVKGPIKTKLGNQIIRLSEMRNIQNPEYLKNKEAIERTLIEKQFKHQLKLFTDDLREEAYVKTYL
jgi:peptidyl-prolyl cis-trans isomerase SurA